MIKKGSILFTIFATLGEVAILNIDATTNQAIASLTITDESVKQKYLYYFLCSLKDFVNGIGRGVAQNNINLKILKTLVFLYQVVINKIRLLKYLIMLIVQ